MAIKITSTRGEVSYVDDNYPEWVLEIFRREGIKVEKVQPDESIAAIWRLYTEIQNE